MLFLFSELKSIYNKEIDMYLDRITNKFIEKLTNSDSKPFV